MSDYIFKCRCAGCNKVMDLDANDSGLRHTFECDDCLTSTPCVSFKVNESGHINGLRPCSCGSRPDMAAPCEENGKTYQVQCRCGRSGPACSTTFAAVEEWNKTISTKENRSTFMVDIRTGREKLTIAEENIVARVKPPVVEDI